MLRAAYNLGLCLYRAAATLAKPFHPKARKLIDGRKGLSEALEKAFQQEQRPVIWLHCASLGEFEQGRPILEKLRLRHPEKALLLTFFSPSGYEVRKDFEGADYVFYLPFDTAENAHRFVQAVKPEIALFVKYDLWYHYLAELQEQHIPTVLFAARFHAGQGFFKWYGGMQRQMLHLLSAIEVQDETSAKMLVGLGLKNVSVSGDPRFDRVAEAAQNAQPVAVLEAFKKEAKLLIAGSTWPDDEKLLKTAFNQLPHNWKMVIVPHEIGEAHLTRIEKLFNGETVRWSAGKFTQKRIMLVDTVGLLLRMYRAADIAYVGGGFGRAGIHNVLEPAAMGAPVLHGTVFHQFLEAQQLLAAGGSLVVENEEKLNTILKQWTSDEQLRKKAGDKARIFVLENVGAADKILATIEKQLAVKQK